MHSHPKILPSRPILANTRITSPTAAAKILPCSRSLQCRNSGANDVAALKRRARQAEAGTSRSNNPWTMSDVESPPSGSCVVTKERNVDTRNLGRTERVGVDAEIGCRSTVEAVELRDAFHGWEKGPLLILHIDPLVIVWMQTEAHCTRGVEERLG